MLNRPSATACVAVFACGCSYKSQTATFIEAEYGITISITLQLVNPFNGGYSRFVTVAHESPQGMSGTLHTVSDVFVFGRVNLYQMEGPALSVLGNIERLVVDLKTGSSGSDDSARMRRGRFLGSFDEDPSRVWRFIKAVERAKSPVH